MIDYGFTATAGTLMLLDSLGSSTGNIRFRLLNPDGTPAFTNQDSTVNRVPLLLEQSGNYRLQIYGFWQYDGDLQV